MPVVGLIFALPLIGLSPESAGALAKGSSTLIIGAVAYILFQAVSLGEKAVLARYDITAADNLQARKVYTQVHVLSKTLYVIIGIFTVASVLMLFEEVRQFGTSILASAGVVGIVIGFAVQLPARFNPVGAKFRTNEPRPWYAPSPNCIEPVTSA